MWSGGFWLTSVADRARWGKGEFHGALAVYWHWAAGRTALRRGYLALMTLRRDVDTDVVAPETVDLAR